MWEFILCSKIREKCRFELHSLNKLHKEESLTVFHEITALDLLLNSGDAL